VDLVIFFLVSQFWMYGDILDDPILTGFVGADRLRTMECERMSQAEAHRRFPGAVPAPNVRAEALMQIDALHCSPLVVDVDARDPRDAAILASLSSEVDALAGLAATAVPDGTRFVVDAHYPNPVIVQKVANATRVALAERGRLVSDRPPRLTAGDVEVFRTLQMKRSIEVSCRRLTQLGELGGEDDDVAHLSIALLHAQESTLHAGLCHRGEFKWLR